MAHYAKFNAKFSKLIRIPHTKKIDNLYIRRNNLLELPMKRFQPAVCFVDQKYQPMDHLHQNQQLKFTKYLNYKFKIFTRISFATANRSTVFSTHNTFTNMFSKWKKSESFDTLFIAYRI